MNKNSNYDVIIIGAGVSGMILANEILSRTKKKILVIERRKRFSYDKNLCFWSKPYNLLTNIANNEWKNIVIYSNGKKIICKSNNLKYQRIDSKTFYNFFLQRFKNNEKITLLMNSTVGKIKYFNNQIILNTTKKIFRANQVFDSRLNQEDLKNVRLFQHFGGVEIEIKKPIFKKNEVVLMDIQNKRNKFNFIYILPFSEKKALIETTYFSPEILSKDIYMKDIEKYLNDKFKIKNYDLKYEEFGIIPMSNVVNNKQKNIFKIGIAGNWNRLSTGYSLQNSFIYSKQIVDRLLNNKPPKIYKNIIFNILDNIFCNFILTHPEKVKDFFSNLFLKNKLIDIVNFLNSSSNFINTIRIIITLPKISLIQSLFKFKKW